MWPGRAVKKEGEEGRTGGGRSLSGKTGKTVERERGKDGEGEREEQRTTLNEKSE